MRCRGSGSELALRCRFTPIRATIQIMPEQPAAIGMDAASAPVPMAAAIRHRIFLYLGILIILLAFGAPSGGLIDIPVTFFLKNKLSLKAHELADFRLL